MKYSAWLILCFCAFILLVAGCPRDTGNTETKGTEASDNGGNGSESQENPCEEQPCAEGNPCSGDNPCAEENPCGEQPCAKNPCGEQPCEPDSENPCNPCEPMDNIKKVLLTTSKGEIMLDVHFDWAPLGAARFIELVEAGFYNEAPWFRVFKDPQGISVAQAGIAADPAVTAQWQERTIMDEKVIIGNKPGTLAFGKTQFPNSRSTHIFINLSDNSQALDFQGFAAFAEIVKGMDVALALQETGSGAVDQSELSRRGIEYFRQVAPDGDVIEKAEVVE